MVVGADQSIMSYVEQTSQVINQMPAELHQTKK